MTQAQTIKHILQTAAVQLGTEEANLEAQLLLQHVLNVNRAWLIAHADDVLNGFEMANFNALVLRRLNGDPIAYILGYREFYGLKLKVSPDTLIPRPDTETLVKAALAKILQNNNSSSPSFPRKRESMLNLNHKMDSRFRGNDEPKILDLGTGSGAIALAIAKHAPHAQVTAVDFSANAIEIARQNAEDLTVLNCQFLQSDWFSALTSQKFDVIVSNPPYIEANDAHLKQGDLRFEPMSALASGVDGLDDIRSIVAQAKNHLNSNGWLMLEHGYNQAAAVANLFNIAGFSQIAHAKDLSGINRITFGCMAE